MIRSHVGQIADLPPDRRSGPRRGQAALEYVILLAGVVTPLTFGIISVAQMMWVWHSIVDFTNQGARYAATHCWQNGGENVLTWMRANVPPVPDQEQFRSGSVEITAEYFKRSPESGQLEPFACDGAECSTECIPDLVTIHVRGYEWRQFLTYLGVPPVPMPDFSTTLPMESAGCDPQQAVCLP